MRILIISGKLGLKNMGDVGMLQVEVARLKDLWPKATIQVVTDEPNLLKKYCPEAYPISPNGRDVLLIHYSNLFGRFHRFIPKLYTKQIKNYRWFSFTKTLLRLKMKLKRLDYTDVKNFLDLLLKADLVVASGGGYFSDVCGPLPSTLLEVLKMASYFGKTTAILGQGFGAITNSKLLEIGKTVLPMIDMIFTREKREGPALLDSFNVKPTRVVITGDDSIELAYEARVAEFGSGIGLNLRIAYYSEVDKNYLEIIRAVLHSAARKYNAPLIPVPISFYEIESDVHTIQHLLAGYDDTSDGGQRLDTPLKVINQVGHCRIVVTGSYHAAVFALSQGIPVVGFIKSAYYEQKFLGLADQFGAGCNVVFLQDKYFNKKLMVAIEDAWNSAVHIRPQLLEAAARQIESGKSAYRRLYNLVESRKR